MLESSHSQRPDTTAEINPPLPTSSRCVILAVVALAVCYAVALLIGWPQRATEMIAGEIHAAADAAATAANSPAASGQFQNATGNRPAEQSPPLYMVTPFVLMLAAIAVIPLLHGAKHWWENNLHRFYVAGALAALTVLYYALAHPYPIVGHFPAQHVSSVYEGETIHFSTVRNMLANALLNEYVPFIVLLLSLYTISGGIRVTGNLRASPRTNVAFLAIGAMFASFIGTTGAAMMLIRPLLETNKNRKHVAHTIIMFTFIVCNCGGCLLPLGDPPLFLGYLHGVPFFWTLNLWREWLFVNGALLALYWVWDQFYFFQREEQRDLDRRETVLTRLHFAGLSLNALLLAGVILAVAFLDPSKALPGTNWRPWLYLREVVQLLLLALSLFLGSPKIRKLNDFNFAPIVEVAVLFFGIFICMQPALQILNVHGTELGLNSPAKFFWATGTLSSFLDNAPTYLVFFEAATTGTHSLGSGILALQSGQFIRQDFLTAISLGAVFMGAMTYIGNGPNFMVKSIAESSGVRMPTFFGYMAYSCAILLPLLVLLNMLFL